MQIIPFSPRDKRERKKSAIKNDTVEEMRKNSDTERERTNGLD
jgi:hypothetical protein